MDYKQLEGNHLQYFSDPRHKLGLNGFYDSFFLFSFFLKTLTSSKLTLIKITPVLEYNTAVSL